MVTSALQALGLGRKTAEVEAACQHDWLNGRLEKIELEPDGTTGSIRTADKYTGYVSALDYRDRPFKHFRSIPKNPSATYRMVFALDQDGQAKFVGRIRKQTKWAKARRWR